MENYKSTCIKCGKPIPLGANFCHYCQTAQGIDAFSYSPIDNHPDRPYNETAAPDLVTSSVLFCRNLGNLAGHMGRADFWWSTVGISLVEMVLGFLAIISFGSFRRLGEEMSLLTAAPLLILLAIVIAGNITAQIRRLHDTGHSGRLWLINLIPLGSLIFFLILCEPSRQQHNRYIQKTGK